MKRILLLVTLSSLVLFSCKEEATPTQEEPTEPNKEVQNQTVDILSDNVASAHLALVPALYKMKMDNTPNKVLLDIRTPEELAENGTIEGAINVDYYADDFQAEIEKLDRDVPVMLYCRSGGRSGEAALLLKELGFKQVYDMQGGYNAWLEADLEN